MRNLALILAAASLAATGCGIGTFSPEPTYTPVVPEMKPLSSAGVGVLPIDDERPPQSHDTQGNGSLGCIFLGGLAGFPSAHVEHIESTSCDTLTGYANQLQSPDGKGSPAYFLRADLIQELSKANILGPAKAVDRPDAAPFTVKAVLKSTALDASLYCFTPMDTTWIFWMLGVPFAGYDFHLTMDVSLYGPGGGKPLWTRTITAKSSGITSMYYDTGVTGENNLQKIYGDLLASQLADAAEDLQKTLRSERPELWRRAADFANAQAAAQASAAQGDNGAPAAPAAAGSSAPWWK